MTCSLQHRLGMLEGRSANPLPIPRHTSPPYPPHIWHPTSHQDGAGGKQRLTRVLSLTPSPSCKPVGISGCRLPSSTAGRPIHPCRQGLGRALANAAATWAGKEEPGERVGMRQAWAHSLLMVPVSPAAAAALGTRGVHDRLVLDHPH